MRVLLLGINFHPELTGIGKYTGEMASYLSREGHEVRVVTTPPYYPHWKVGPGYRWWGYRLEEWQGIRVYRTPLWVPRSPSGIKRLTHLLSFAIFSSPVALGQALWRPEVVVCIAPAFFSAPFALVTARLSKAKVWLHIQDFELEAAVNLGILPANKVFARLAARVEGWLLSQFDRVSTISNQMLMSLKEKGVDHRRTGYFPNWVDTNEIYPITDPHGSLCGTFGVPDDKVIVMYSGNMGEKQGLELMIEAARRLGKVPDIHFVLCGDGAARRTLESAAEGLPNVQFLPLQPFQRLNQLLNMADIHILPQKAGAADLVMPSKLLGMLASGKAVIATAEQKTEIGEVVGSVGVLVPPGEIDQLCAAILDLASAPGKRSSCGQKGRAYVLEHWSADRILSDFQTQLHDLISS